MALQPAPQLGGDFIRLAEVAANGPVLAVFRIKEFLPPEPATGFNGTNVPVIADVWFIDGPMAGEVHLGERWLGAITAQLRGVKNPNVQKGIGVSPPVNQLGAEIVCQIQVVNQGRSNEGVYANPPSPTVMKQVVEPAYAAMGGEQLWAFAERNAAQLAAAQPPAQPAPVQHVVPSAQLGQPAATPTQPEPAGADQAALAAQLAALQAQLAAAQAGPQPAAVGAGASNGADAGGERPVWQPAQ